MKLEEYHIGEIIYTEKTKRSGFLPLIGLICIIAFTIIQFLHPEQKMDIPDNFFDKEIVSLGGILLLYTCFFSKGTAVGTKGIHRNRYFLNKRFYSKEVLYSDVESPIVSIKDSKDDKDTYNYVACIKFNNITWNNNDHGDISFWGEKAYHQWYLDQKGEEREFKDLLKEKGYID